jgi:divalent metal cation (Fe/Co/Zn/Cd) transporter
VRVSIAGIMDEADEKLLKDIVLLLNKNRKENWIDLHNMRIIKYGSKLHCDCHLTVPWYLNVNEAHAEVEALGALIRNEFGNAVELFVHSDGCLDFSCKICTKQNCMVRQHDFEKRIRWTIENISKDSKHNINTED